MEITTQQKGDQLSRRNFKLKNGSYENSAYNDGGVPVHYIIVAWMQEPRDIKWDKTRKTWVEFPRSQKIQKYIDKFYPSWDKNCGAIVLGETNSDEIDSELLETPREVENRFIYLQELAVKLADDKGLIPEYTLLDIAECNFAVTLYGEKGES